MTQSIYEQHDKAFANVSAFIIMKDGERVATAILAAVNGCDGEDWNRNIEKAGFVVLQAV